MAYNRPALVEFYAQFHQESANKRGKDRIYWGLVYFLGPRISETSDKKTANNKCHLYTISKIYYQDLLGIDLLITSSLTLFFVHYLYVCSITCNDGDEFVFWDAVFNDWLTCASALVRPWLSRSTLQGVGVRECVWASEFKRCSSVIIIPKGLKNTPWFDDNRSESMCRGPEARRK